MTGFTGAGLDRADHLRFRPGEVAALAGREDARLLDLALLDPVLDEADRLSWSAFNGAGETIFLGFADGVPLFAPLVSDAPPGRRAWSIFGLLGRMERRDAAIWATARSLNEWHSGHPCCARCGAPTEPFRAGWGRKCGACAAEHFPRVDPVVIMLAEHEGKVLVGRQHQYPPGRYSALAGFVEHGESIEEAVRRELLEEAGVAVGEVRYVASQPWPFPGSLMIGCHAFTASDALTLDPAEIEHAIWVDRGQARAALAGDADAVFQAPPPYAIAHTLLAKWVEEEGERG
ncbi:NAD(+) diphosphatase [Sphingosinicella sp.]|uniref:NAD(+) diphosphatase n=1 Tax=Sphingosinicella sp. TaxID=1917971 RepID=UPI004037D73B